MGALEQAQAGAGSVTPQLAEAAAAAGAPPPQQEAAPEQAAPQQAAPQAPQQQAPTPQPGGPAPQGPGNNPGDVVQKYGQQASPEEQQEYERAMRALVKILYSNDDTANSIVDQVDPNDIVSSTSKVGMLLIKEMDRKVNMDQSVIASVTEEAVTRIAELAEARHQVEYQPTDMEKIIGATWEGVQVMFGGDPQNFTQTVQSMDPNDLSALKQQQDAILGQAQ